VTFADAGARGEPGYRSNIVHCSHNPIAVPRAAELCCYGSVRGLPGRQMCKRAPTDFTARPLRGFGAHLCICFLVLAAVMPWAATGADAAPLDNEIHVREAGAWQRYSWQIASIGAVILIQAGLIAILLEEHRRRRLAELQARDRMRELARVNRYSTAGELTASIAHEINQPLGSILANAETAQAILRSPSPDIDELNSIVDDIIHDNRRASEVIRRMRSLLKKTPFEAKRFDFNEVVGDAVDFLSAFAVGRKVALEKATTPDALPIVGDRIQLQQVLINLMVNAFEAMTDARGVDRKIGIRTLRVGNFAELSISDNGPGIPEDRLKEVFEPFVTSKAEGMGMGLSIARTIVEAHSGRIWGENQSVGGAVFLLSLPLASTRTI
jgi:signal transduction histidine kinase